MQVCYNDDAELLGRVMALLDLSFPGLQERAEALAPLGAHWDQVSTPFLAFDEHVLVSHVGVMKVSLVMDGAVQQVGGIHAVCTHPAYRKRGFFHQVMTEALAWCDQRFKTTILIGDEELYVPFGYRCFREHRFKATVALAPGASFSDQLRELDLNRPEDLQLLHRLLDERAPVSNRLGVVRERAVFLFKQATKPIWYAEKLDAIVCGEVDGSTLHLFDIVANPIPSFDEVLSCMERTISSVEVYFSPDQLNASFAPEHHMLEDDSPLMVRGTWPKFDGGVTLPKTARM